MAENRGKSPDKAAAAPADEGAEPGHLGQDDRGNVTWEWANEEDLAPDEALGTIERVTALVDPSLKIQDDDGPGNSAIQSNPKGLTKGYNPYSSGALGKTNWKKTKDLRQLSKWIELRKKVAQKPPEE